MSYLEHDHYTIKLPTCGDRNWWKEPYESEVPELKNLCDLSGTGFSVRIVGRKTHPEIKGMVYELAGFFRAEFGYDFRPFNPDHDDDQRRDFMWYGRGERFTRGGFKSLQYGIGACGFQMTEFKSGRKCWDLCWAWIHPYQRGNGLLGDLWPYLRKRYGDFWVQQPLSTAMMGFLISKGYDEVLNAMVPNAITNSSNQSVTITRRKMTPEESTRYTGHEFNEIKPSNQ